MEEALQRHVKETKQVIERNKRASQEKLIKGGLKHVQLFLRWRDPIPKVLDHGVSRAWFTLDSNSCLKFKKEVALHPRHE